MMDNAAIISKKQSIETAPRDGTIVFLWWEDTPDEIAEGPWPMRWEEDMVNPLVGNSPGIWVTTDKSFTWMDSPEGGPEFWAPYKESLN